MTGLFFDTYALVVAVTLVGALIFVTCVIQYVGERRRRLERSYLTLDDFVDSFRGTDIPRELCVVVYHELPRFRMIVKSFPVRAQDDLASVYGVGGQYGTPLCELIEDLAPACGLVLSAPAELAALIQQESPIVTVADLVRLLAGLRKHGKAVSE